MRSYFALSLLLGAACADDEGRPEPPAPPPSVGDAALQKALSEGQTFVPVYRADGRTFDLGSAGARSAPPSAQTAAAGPTFYVALRRESLSREWFLSAYMKQYLQDPALSPTSTWAARSLGTRVVTFRTGNGKLYVLDTGTGRTFSDVFDPDIIVEAFPIVTGFSDFDRLPDAGKYVLIDPAGGLNRFDIETDQGLFVPNAQFTVDLAYTQNFRPLEDGMAFEKVFTGYRAPNNVRASGTLGLSVRRYGESPGFTAAVAPRASSHFFTTLPRAVANEGRTETLLAKWPIQFKGG